MNIADIKSVKSGRGTFYLVKDLIKKTGLTQSQVEKITKPSTRKVQVPTTVGKSTVKVYHNVVNSLVAKRVICAATKSTVTKKVTKTPASTPVLTKLETAEKRLKTVVDKIFTKTGFKTNGLLFTGKGATIRNDARQIEARRATRNTIESFVTRVAEELEITELEQKSTLFDIAYQTLYTQYKKITPDKIDLKAKAEFQNNSNCGNKISALQMAEQLGVSEELFNLAKLIFNK